MPPCRFGSLSFALVWPRSTGNLTFARLPVYGLYGIWPLASADPIPTSCIIFLLAIHPASINIMAFTECYLSHVEKKLRRRGTNKEWLAKMNIVRLSNLFRTHTDFPKQRRQKKFFSSLILFYGTRMPCRSPTLRSRAGLSSRLPRGSKKREPFRIPSTRAKVAACGHNPRMFAGSQPGPL